MPIHVIISRYFWLLPIIVICTRALIWWRRSRKEIVNHPEAAKGYARLIWGFVVWGLMPWVFMGIGCVLTGLTIFDYAEPRGMNLLVLGWYLTAFVLLLLLFGWVLLGGLSDSLFKHPGLFNLTISAKAIKWITCLSGLGGLVAVISRLLMIFTISSHEPSVGSQFKTIFLIYNGALNITGVAFLWIGIGLTALVVGIRWIRKLRLPQWWNKKEGFRPGFILFFGSIWLLASIIGFTPNVWRAWTFAAVYGNGQALSVEGQVHVLFQQPRGGHTKGDIIQVGTVQFEINYFNSIMNPGYTTTIAYGGALREGVYARIAYYDGSILSLKVRKTVATQPSTESADSPTTGPAAQ